MQLSSISEKLRFAISKKYLLSYVRNYPISPTRLVISLCSWTNSTLSKGPRLELNWKLCCPNYWRISFIQWPYFVMYILSDFPLWSKDFTSVIQLWRNTISYGKSVKTNLSKHMHSSAMLMSAVGEDPVPNLFSTNEKLFYISDHMTERMMKGSFSEKIYSCLFLRN